MCSIQKPLLPPAPFQYLNLFRKRMLDFATSARTLHTRANKTHKHKRQKQLDPFYPFYLCRARLAHSPILYTTVFVITTYYIILLPYYFAYIPHYYGIIQINSNGSSSGAAATSCNNPTKHSLLVLSGRRDNII